MELIIFILLSAIIAVTGGVIGAVLMLKTVKDKLVEDGYAEYYLDEKCRRQWQMTAIKKIE